MHFIQHILCITFYLLGFCSALKTRALVITKENNEFKLAIPDSYSPYKKESKFTIPPNGKSYLFCRADDKIQGNSYLKAMEIQPSDKFTDTDKCSNSGLPLFVKVKNPQDWKGNIWDATKMELYHTGYLLSTHLPGEEHKKHDTTEVNEAAHKGWTSTRYSISNDIEMAVHGFTKRKPEYEGWGGPSYEFVVEIEAYYDKTIKQIVAVEYTLYSTNLPFYEQPFHKDYITQYGNNNLYVPLIMIYTDRSEYSYVNEFENKLSKNWIKTLKDTKKDNDLSITAFASNLHFPIPLWEQQTLQSFNMFPMFEKPKTTWKRVQQFSRIVAKYLGNLEVKTGITDIMTLSGTEFVDPEGFAFPKYFWNVYEYYNGNEAYGIIVVLNYNCFEKTDMKICETENSCGNYGWIIGNNDFSKGEVYCCGMTRHNIQKLKVNFIALKEKPIFNLHKWEDKMKEVKKEFVELLEKEARENESDNVK